jgi:hypothetical protein
MATNMALKRARKAQRRKQVVAQKRRAEIVEASLPARVLRAAHAPIQHCFLTESVFDIGMGTLVLARGATLHHVAFSVFLIDTFCLGIKDVMFESVESEVFEMYMEVTDAGSPMVSVHPSYARKLLRNLAAWSQSIGFRAAPGLRSGGADVRRRERGHKRRGLSVRARRQALLYSRPERYHSTHSAPDRATAEVSRR